MDMIKDLIFSKKGLRYLIIGVMTTGVNLLCFALFQYVFHWDLVISNTVAVFCAIVFAFFTNKTIVFQSEYKTPFSTIKQLVSFFGSRFFTMFIEVVGVSVMTNLLGIHAMVSKILIQVVVLVLNYLISNFFVFKDKAEDSEEESLEDWYKKYFVYLWTGAIVTLFMFAIWVGMGVAPFGDHAMTLIDCVHQYVPFFSVYYDKLMNGGDMFYTWQLGMGANFLSLFAYYLSSPFNYLVMLFQKKDIPSAISLIVTIKIILSGLSFAVFLMNKTTKTDEEIEGSIKIKREETIRGILAIGLSVAYAINNYVIGYYWNVMWMDAIMAFPIIILGLDRIVHKRDARLYILALTYTFFCNYYISFMICIAIVMYYFMLDFKDIRNFLVSSLYTFLSSMLSAGLLMMMLYPAYLSIKNTASAHIAMPKFVFYRNFFDVLQAGLVGTDAITNQVDDGGLNLYCGTLALFGIFLYLINGKISVKNKILRVLAIVFLIFSFNTEVLNYIWHGFHNQYGIPNRFSFVLIFLALWMCYDAFSLIRKIKPVWVIVSYFAIHLFLLLAFLYSDVKLPAYCYLVSVVLFTLYLFLIMSMIDKKEKYRVIQISLMTAVLSIELCISGAYNFVENGNVNLPFYFDSTIPMMDAVKSVKDGEDPNDLYRSEILVGNMVDENSWHNLNSVGVFGSTAIGDMVTTMGRLGFYTGANEYLYKGSTPFTDAILNVKYIYQMKEDDFNTSSFEYKDTVSGVAIYENKYRLPMAFVVKDTIYTCDYESLNPFVVQNNIATSMTGLKGEMFHPYQPEFVVSSTNCDVQLTQTNSFYYTSNTSTDTKMITATFTIPHDMDLYVDAKGNNIKKLRLIVDGEELAYNRYQSQIFHIGHMKEDQSVTITYEMNDTATEGNLSLLTYTFHQNQFEKKYEILNKNILTYEQYSDKIIRGNIHTDSDGTVFTSIPYEQGWNVYVDGEKVMKQKLLGAFLGFHVDEGDHEITIKYMPEGFILGVAISMAAWILFFIYLFMLRRREKDHQ